MNYEATMNYETTEFARTAGILLVASFAVPTAALDATGRAAVAAAAETSTRENTHGAGVSKAELESFAKAKVRADEISAFWAESIARSSDSDPLKRLPNASVSVVRRSNAALSLVAASINRFATSR